MSTQDPSSPCFPPQSSLVWCLDWQKSHLMLKHVSLQLHNRATQTHVLAVDVQTYKYKSIRARLYIQIRKKKETQTYTYIIYHTHCQLVAGKKPSIHFV